MFLMDFTVGLFKGCIKCVSRYINVSIVGCEYPGEVSWCREGCVYREGEAKIRFMVIEGVFVCVLIFGKSFSWAV